MAFKHCSGNTLERLGAGWHSPSLRPHFGGEVWEFYKTLPQFNTVVESQFVVRLRDHRTKASEYLHQTLQEEQYFARDRLLYPRQSHNERGEPVFDKSPGKALLREDVSNGIHTTMSVARLQNSIQIQDLQRPRRTSSPP
jgi:hypothetical protein